MDDDPTPHNPGARWDGGPEGDAEPSVSRSLTRRRAGVLFEASSEPIVECGFVGDTAIARRTNRAFERAFGIEASAEDIPVAEFFAELGVEDPPEARKQDEPVELTVDRPTAGGPATFSLRIEPLGPGAGDDDHRQLVIYGNKAGAPEYDAKLASLHDATRELIKQDSKEGVARRAVGAAVGVLDFRVSSVHLYDEDRDALVPTVTTERVRDLLGDLPALHPGESLAWEVFESGEHAVYDSISDHPNAYNQETALESELIAPLGDHGVFLAGSTEENAFTETDVSLATILASNTEAALDRIEREEALAAREAELERKNERLEAFAGMVSHDLRNPLNVAQGCLELARMEEDMSRLDEVATAHDRMEALIEDLLELARQGEDIGELDTVSVAAIAQQAWSLVDTGDASIEIESDIGTVDADRSRLAAALENLFRNAIDHGGEDVTVTVGATADGFYVADDGPGVDVSDPEQLFEVGYSGETGGTGIGLAIVADVASAHGWDVTVTEASGGGARFEIAVSDSEH